MDGIWRFNGDDLTVMVIVIRDKLHENTIKLLYPTFRFRLEMGWIFVAPGLVMTLLVENCREVKG